VELGGTGGIAEDAPGGHNLYDFVMARRKGGKGEASGGVGRDRSFAGVELLIAVEVEEDAAPRECRLGSVVQAVAVDVVPHDAADRRKEPATFK